MAEVKFLPSLEYMTSMKDKTHLWMKEKVDTSEESILASLENKTCLWMKEKADTSEESLSASLKNKTCLWMKEKVDTSEESLMAMFGVGNSGKLVILPEAESFKEKVDTSEESLLAMVGGGDSGKAVTLPKVENQVTKEHLVFFNVSMKPREDMEEVFKNLAEADVNADKRPRRGQAKTTSEQNYNAALFMNINGPKFDTLYEDTSEEQFVLFNVSMEPGEDTEEAIKDAAKADTNAEAGGHANTKVFAEVRGDAYAEDCVKVRGDTYAKVLGEGRHQ